MAKRKKVSGKKLITAVVIDEIKTCNMQTADFLPGYTVIIGFNYQGNETYTRPFKDGSGFRIQIGGQMIVNYLGIPEYIYDEQDKKDFIRATRIMTRAFFYHEVGHLLYTDMYDRSIIDYKEQKYIPFLHALFNVMEDPRMENYGMSMGYPKLVPPYFRYTTKKMFEDHMTEYKDDPHSPGAFLNFLLFKLRLRKKFKGTSEVFEKHKKQLVPLINAFFNEDDPTERIHKSITVGEYLIKNTDWDFTQVEEPEDPISGKLAPMGPGSGPGKLVPGTEKGDGNTPGPLKPRKGHKASKGKKQKSGKTKTAGDGGGSMPGPDANLGEDTSDEKSGSSSNNRGSDSLGEPEEADLKNKNELEDDDTDEELENTYTDENCLAIDSCPEVDDAYNNTLDEYKNGENHTFIRAKDYYIPRTSTRNAIADRLGSPEIIKLADGVKNSLDVYRSRVKPKWNRGFKSGKVDMRKAMSNSLTKKPDIRVFERKISNGIAPDLAISVLCDNSGSMRGTKSHVCTTAMLALAKACSICNIPLEVNCFTESWRHNMNYTIQMKGFDEPYDTAKEYFGITDDDIYRGYMDDMALREIQFANNEDEVNLNYVWKQFRRNEHKDKLIIVISDGETCGSSERLRQLVSEIERDGINVIGLGIQSSAAESIYPHCKLFDTDTSLNDLPAFLTSTLLSFCTKGGK